MQFTVGSLCSLQILLLSLFFLSLLPLHYWCVQLDEVALWQVLCFSQRLPPFPPGLSVLQGHLNPDSMDEQHSEKLWLYSSTNLPRSAPSSVSKAQLLDGHIEFRMRGFKTDNGKVHDCTRHYRPIYWTVCALFSQTVCRLWQTVNRAERIFLLCGIWMVILKCTSLTLTTLHRDRVDDCCCCWNASALCVFRW